MVQNDSLATLLARMEGILGPLPRWMLRKGRYSHRFYTRAGVLYEQARDTVRAMPLPPRAEQHSSPRGAMASLSATINQICTVAIKRPGHGA